MCTRTSQGYADVKGTFLFDILLDSLLQFYSIMTGQNHWPTKYNSLEI